MDDLYVKTPEGTLMPFNTDGRGRRKIRRKAYYSSMEDAIELRAELLAQEMTKESTINAALASIRLSDEQDLTLTLQKETKTLRLELETIRDRIYVMESAKQIDRNEAAFSLQKLKDILVYSFKHGVLVASSIRILDESGDVDDCILDLEVSKYRKKMIKDRMLCGKVNELLLELREANPDNVTSDIDSVQGSW